MSSYLNKISGQSATLKYLLLAYAAGTLGGLILELIFPAGLGGQTVPAWFFLPIGISNFIHQPWTFFTWPFVSVLDSSWAWTVILNGLFLYQFGVMFQTHLSEKRLIEFFLYIWLFSGMLTFVACSFFPGIHAEGAHLFGISALVAGLLAAMIVLIPKMPIQLMLIGSIPLWIPAAILLAYRALSPTSFSNPAEMTSVVSGGLLGAIYIWQLREGRDIPNLIFGKLIYKLSRLSIRKKGKFTFVQDEVMLKGEDEMNRLLDKIGKSGYNSLSKAEKGWLERYK